MTPPFDTRQVRRAFSRAAASYREHAVLQREVEDRLLERLDFMQNAPSRVLDVGAGPGRASAALRKRWPKAELIALDLALPMLREARRASGWFRKLPAVCADARALPLPDASIDVLFSSLCIQWIEDLPALFAEFRRVLRPGGFIALSTFGPDTLHELRAAWAAADRRPHVSHFVDLMRLGDAMMRAGFKDPVLDGEHFTLTYADATALMRDLKAIGATNAEHDRARGLTGKTHFSAVSKAYEAFRHDGVLPATYEVLYAHAWGPEPGAPRRHGGEEIATFPVDKLRIRRRGE